MRVRFSPGTLHKEIDMHDSAYNDAKNFVEKYLASKKGQPLRIADVGSYDVNGTLRPLFESSNWADWSTRDWVYTGFDISAGPNVDVVLSKEYGWSSEYSKRFDVVVTTQVMEHVRKPWLWIKDIVEIYKSGGLIYVCTPCGGVAFHEFPIDCWRTWPDGMRAVLEEADVDVLDCYMQAEDTTGIARRR